MGTGTGKGGQRMTGKKKSHSSVAAPERDMEQGTLFEDTFNSDTYSTPSRPARQIKVSDLLSRGAQNGVSTQHLVSIMGVPERVVRQMIQRERLAGVPILSDTQNGYYLPDNRYEVTCCVRSLRHRGNEILEVANAIERATGGSDGK